MPGLAAPHLARDEPVPGQVAGRVAVRVGRGHEGVEQHRLVPGRGEQVRDMGADEARTARDEYPHGVRR